MPTYVPYSSSIEVIQAGEEQIFDEIAGIMRNIAETIGDRARHMARPVHAKSHGLLRAELTIVPDLPEHLSQGLFAEAATYPAIMRFSTNPGDILPDRISTPRGLAVKVIGVTGEMLAGCEGQVTQDFVCVNAKAFPSPDAAGFLSSLKFLQAHITDSQALKQVVSTTSRLAEQALETVGGKSDALLGFGHPETHILGETFSSVAALRYGNYVAKIAFEPASENLKALHKLKLDSPEEFSAIRDAVVKFFEKETAVWNVMAQLMTDATVTPVEDASVEWTEKDSPSIKVATLTALPQNAYSAQRRVFVDELLAFNPWHGLAAHRPLGGVMRARKKAYAMASTFRRQMNSRPMIEPQSIDELPD